MLELLGFGRLDAGRVPRDAAEQARCLLLGARIRRCRLDRGLSPDRLAAAAGMPVDELLAVEAGLRRLTPSEVPAVTTALGVPRRVLFPPRR